MPRVSSPAADRGTGIHGDLEHSLRDSEYVLKAPFSYYNDFLATLRKHGARPEKTILLNKSWEPVLPWEDPWVKTILDVALTDGTTARNYDWKTGKIYPDHYDQRELYSLVQLCENPLLDKAIGMHVYVDLKENRVSEFTREELPALKAKWEERVRPLFEDEIFPTNPSYACRYCEFSKYNGGPCRF